MTEDWTGRLDCGIKLDWDYKNKTVDLSMPGYTADALHKFQHKEPLWPQHTPYPARVPQYGSKVQLMPELDTSASLSPAGKKRIQQVVGSLLYYGLAVYPSISNVISALTAIYRHRGYKEEAPTAPQLLCLPPRLQNSIYHQRHPYVCHLFE
jgi:hypothetical protein